MEDLPPADGQVHWGKSHLMVCARVFICVLRGTVRLKNTVPPLVFMPLICNLGKRAECFPEARIRLFLVKMH